MTLHDWLFHHFYDIAPTVIIITVCGGSVMLWRATRRLAALIQILSALMMLGAWSLFELRIQTTGEFETTGYSLFLRAPWLRFAVDAWMWAGTFVFSIAYAWHSMTTDKHLRRKRGI